MRFTLVRSMAGALLLIAMSGTALSAQTPAPGAAAPAPAGAGMQDYGGDVNDDNDDRDLGWLGLLGLAGLLGLRRRRDHVHVDPTTTRRV